jgi:hypothetical protein
MTGCLSGAGAEATDTTRPIDPFPKPGGPRIIPLTKAFKSRFAYAGFDSAGGKVQGLDEIILHVSPRPGGAWTYAFQDSTQGYLVRYVETANRDSAGVWIVGRFRDGNDTLDSIPTLWVPQYPDTGKVRSVGRGRQMRMEDSAATYYTGNALPGPTRTPMVQGFQKHTAYRFRETHGDTVTLYHFKHGLGCLGFERSAGGRLLAAGTLVGFSNP